MHFESLTPEGRAWAEAHAGESLLARVALQGYSLYAGVGWPVAHVEAAIKVCNERGSQVAA